ncbi:inner membrane protein [gamma proteobacterium NOR5-3]|nr:inner membrane protein [gamma proteobacterium NOR5-3]
MAEGDSPDKPAMQLFPGVLLRGVLMGAADIVPGVSGGTMAFITGIYHRLITAITAFDMTLIRCVFAGRWRVALERTDAAFLATLLLGIAISVFSLASVISSLLETQPLLLWSFFFGLILASALVLIRHVSQWTVMAAFGLVFGALFAAGVGLSPAFELPVAPWSFFLAGFFAICAMILPGISGSFILVLLGMYPAVLAAIEALELVSMGLFAAGAGVGLLVFSRLLSYLLRVHHSATLATLTGFLCGSLLVVWPWKTQPEDAGAALPVSPQHYAELFGDSQLIVCVMLMVLGFFAVWLLESRWGGLER